MRNFRSSLLLCLIVASAGAVGAQTQNISITEPLRSLPDTGAITDHINEVTAKIDDAAGAESIMATLLEKRTNEGAEVALGVLPLRVNANKPFDEKDFYCIIHILRWSAPAAANNSQTIQAQNWYLYNNHELTLGNPNTVPRLFGAKNITLLYIHLNKHTANDYQPLYEIEVKKRTPAYISHFLGVAELYRGLSSGDPGSLLLHCFRMIIGQRTPLQRSTRFPIFP
jgi:hypothetical protein